MTTNYQGPKPGPEDKPKIEKVIVGEVVEKPKPLGRKFKDVFFGGDFKITVGYVTGEVLLPALRNLIVDVTSKGIERIVYGDSAFRRRPTTFGSRVQYSNPFQSRPVMTRDPRGPAYLPDQNPYRPGKKEANDIILASREEAELVVERLIDIIDKYGVASLADLYDLLGLPTTHVDNKWGWTFLNTVEIRQTRDGYLIDLPALEAV